MIRHLDSFKIYPAKNVGLRTRRAPCRAYLAYGALVGAMGLSSAPSLSIQGARVGDMLAD